MNNDLLSQILKPNSIDDVIGQEHLVGKHGIIRKMIESNQIFSCIFFGTPGIGKTSLAQAICKSLKLKYDFFNPTIHKKSDLEKIINQNMDNDTFVIIIDEIHRMNRDKQDILLTYLETNKIIVLGTTTENPYFAINPAIRSRCQIFELNPLTKEDMLLFFNKLSKTRKIKLSENTIKLIVNNSLGDLRSAINIFDIITKIYKDTEPNEEVLNKILPNVNVIGSSYGNEFYDLQSAFHKSLRGSDIDASIYYLAKLIKIGDLQSISRRMIAMAYEDIGLANPNLLSRVILAVNSAERVGFPEAHQILATTVIELCLSPKSNSAYLAIKKALDDLDEGAGNLEIPNHLKDAHYKSAYKLGRKGYKYPHDFENNWVEQQYLPQAIKDKKYYNAGKNDIEQKMNNSLLSRKKKLL